MRQTKVNKMSFEGKVVLVTGASSGIGADAARHLSKLGASVALVGRNTERLNAVAEQIKSDGSPAPLVIVADVTKDAERIINEMIAHFNKLDVLVNNAGIIERGNLETITIESLNRLLDTNVRSVIRLTQLATPHLEKTKGNVVNVSSIAGLQVRPNALQYCISKAALDQFTKCASLELAAKGIRVNSINPAAIETPIFQTIGVDLEQFKEHVTKAYPIGRIGQVADTSNAIAFLANDAASFITGILLSVDGGMLNVSLP